MQSCIARAEEPDEERRVEAVQEARALAVPDRNGDRRRLAIPGADTEIIARRSPGQAHTGIIRGGGVPGPGATDDAGESLAALRRK